MAPKWNFDGLVFLVGSSLVRNKRFHPAEWALSVTCLRHVKPYVFRVKWKNTWWVVSLIQLTQNILVVFKHQFGKSLNLQNRIRSHFSVFWSHLNSRCPFWAILTSGSPWMTPNDHIYDPKNSTNVVTDYYAWQNQNHMTIYTSRIEMFAIL